MRYWMFLLSLTACSAGTPPPASPDDANEPELATTPEASDVDSETETESASSDGPTGAAGEPTEQEEASKSSTGTKRDFERVLELVLNDPELQQYLKIDRPDRFPVKVAWDGVPSDADVRKAGQPVEVVSGPENEKDPVLVFTRIEVQGNFARVRYRYDVEGIKGSVSASKSQYGWELKSSRINER